MFAKSVLALVLGLITSSPLLAQEYMPKQELPSGTQIVLIFFSDAGCVGNKNPELGPAIQKIKWLLSERARAQGTSFAAIGADKDWSVDEALGYLIEGKSKWGPQPFGAWDEIVVGGNWLNSVAVNYIWRTTDAVPMMPQLIVLRRTVAPGQTRIELGPDTVLARVYGSDDIVKWMKAGAVIGRDSTLVQ